MFPIIPIVIGAGLVVVAGAAGKKRGKAKGQFERHGTHNNVWIPRNLAALKQLGTRADQIPLVMAVVGVGATPEQTDTTAEILADRAENEPNVNFFWIDDIDLLRKWLEKQPKKDLANTALDPNIGMRLSALSREGVLYNWPIYSGQPTDEAFDELTYFARTGDRSRLPENPLQQ